MSNSQNNSNNNYSENNNEEHEDNNEEQEENNNEDQEDNNNNNNEEEHEDNNEEEHENNNEEEHEDNNEEHEEQLENPDNEDYKAMLTAKDSKDYGIYYKIYNWIDSITFSRPKKSLTRDFSDGVNFVELLNKVCKPSPIQVHTVSRSFNTKQKQANWNEIKNKMNKKTLIKISDEEVTNIINMKPYEIEGLLERVYEYVSEGKSFLKNIKATQKQNPVKNYMKNIESK